MYRITVVERSYYKILLVLRLRERYFKLNFRLEKTSILGISSFLGTYSMKNIGFCL